ncbi:MAG: DUF523 domain-containing protein [Candidatus Muirbacterium halophilum]|nr:DUF523 domain-containing protein [Candidatus Muirbacterium halophilum]MCK9475152.1 DUF523 domain-containing protein [Candidatus Muirbacterium halophilum]
MTGISACLLGFCCRYDGKSIYDENIMKLIKNKKDIFYFCPEQMGGLCTPRIPCEKKNGKIINKNNEDKTQNFVNGAYETIKAIKLFKANKLILKEKSPSCGVLNIYNGNFDGKLISGNGILIDILNFENIKFKILKNESNISYTTLKIL